MSRGKPVQGGVRVKLPEGDLGQLAAMTPEEIRSQEAVPAGFLPLPHPNHAEGGMVFPKFHIDEVKQQTGRDLDALRSRLRPARALPARVPAGRSS